MENSELAIKKGYKQTDVGIIPEDWDLISYDTAFTFLSTATYSRADLSTDNEILYVHYGDIHTKLNDFLDLNNFPLPSIDVKKAKKYSHLEEGDLLMADASEDYEGICKSVEVKNVNGKKAISGLHTFLLRDKKKVFADGFRGYIRSNRAVKTQLERLATGLKVYGVSKTNLKLVLIPLPSLAEQQAIAKILSEVDALITSLDALIAKKRNIKQGTMSLLLKGKKRLPDFSGDWETKKLGEIAEIYQPITISQNDFVNDGYLVYGANGIVGFYHKYNHKTWQITITCRGSTCGTVNKTVEKSWITGNAMVINLDANKKADKLFFYYLVLNQDFKDCITGSGQPQIVRTPLFNFKLKIPLAIEEQKAIARILSEMDAEIEALEAQREKYKLLKQGLMQELLTGKTRLV